MGPHEPPFQLGDGQDLWAYLSGDEDGGSSGEDPMRPPKPGHKVADEVACVPLSFGNIEGLVPNFLSEPMDFDTADMPVFTYKLLQALHTAALQRAA